MSSTMALARCSSKRNDTSNCIVLACTVWGPHKTAKFQCDNKGVVVQRIFQEPLSCTYVSLLPTLILQMQQNILQVLRTASQQFTVLLFLLPTGRIASHTRGPGDGDRQQSWLDLASVQALAIVSKVGKDLTAQWCFLSFCSFIPKSQALEDTLQMFVGSKGLSHQTIKVYLPGIVCRGVCETDDSQNGVCFKRHQEATSTFKVT